MLGANQAELAGRIGQAVMAVLMRPGAGDQVVVEADDPQCVYIYDTLCPENVTVVTRTNCGDVTVTLDNVISKH